MVLGKFRTRLGRASSAVGIGNNRVGHLGTPWDTLHAVLSVSNPPETQSCPVLPPTSPQIAFTFHKFLLHDETRGMLLTNTQQVVFYLVDLLQDKNKEVRVH